MKKIKKFLLGNIKTVIAFILGVAISGGTVYAATILFSSSEVSYDNTNSELTSTNVQDAIDELYAYAEGLECKKGYVKANETSTGYHCAIPICKRATTLHTATCGRTSDGCYAAGYYSGGSKGTSTITYGNTSTTDGTLTPGDAFDCDVNADGTYNASTERFYYVADEGNNAVLIYYTNVTGGTTATQTNYAYDSNNQNYYGPRTAAAQLPSTAQWSNEQLEAPRSTITNEKGGSTTSGGTISFSGYTGKAARLLTTQELVAGCSSISSVGNYTHGELDGCNWLMENIGQYEGTTGTYGYWLETPCSFDIKSVWGVYGDNRHVGYNSAKNTTYSGVRPVITVLKSNISY